MRQEQEHQEKQEQQEQRERQEQDDQREQPRQETQGGSVREQEHRIPTSNEPGAVRSGERSDLARSGRIPSPWDLIRRMSAELDRLIGNHDARVDWIPQVEVAQRQDALVIRAELPGIAPDAIDVTIDNGVLTISGRREQVRQEKENGLLRTERSYGSFARTIPLPEGVNEEALGARFCDGVLEITVPTGAQARGRRIAVESNSTSRGM